MSSSSTLTSHLWKQVYPDDAVAVSIANDYIEERWTATEYCSPSAAFCSNKAWREMDIAGVAWKTAVWSAKTTLLPNLLPLEEVCTSRDCKGRFAATPSHPFPTVGKR